MIADIAVIFVAMSVCLGLSGISRGGPERLELVQSANADAPNGYAPAPVSCPSARPTIRAATALSPQETEWLKLRHNNTVPYLKNVLGRANITGIDINTYLQTIEDNGQMMPSIGIAFSGGGYRALMNGAGALAAFDSRTVNATGPGQLGGILQAATYVSGLSGGSWLVGSLYVQNFTTVESITRAASGFLSTIWQFNETIIEGPATLSVGEYYRQLSNAVNAKAEVGYDTTITDYWSRALSYQLFNASDGGPGYTFSSIADDVEFSSAMMPMPIVVALERPASQLLIWENSTVFEFNPWEMGSYDPGSPAFAPLRYIGSNFSNGVLPQDGKCMAGFDNVGFVVGTSSSLFNQAFLQIQNAPETPGFFLEAINRTLARIGRENNDISLWPNPFYQYNVGSNRNSNYSTLTLVDGGEDLQNIPLHPLTLSIRQVDVILAIDSSADTPTAWPNGTALVATYHRLVSDFSTNNTFPHVPDQNSFVNLGLNSRPTFFGCEVNNMTDPGPLIVYLPNAPYSYLSNVSTFDLEYTNEERDNIIRNGYDVATMGNASVDPQWPACLGCAILSRSFSRTRTELPSKCVDCYTRHCWNGTVNSTTPPTYEPAQIIPPVSAGGRLISIPVTSYVMASLILAFAVVF